MPQVAWDQLEQALAHHEQIQHGQFILGANTLGQCVSVPCSLQEILYHHDTEHSEELPRKFCSLQVI